MTSYIPLTILTPNVVLSLYQTGSPLCWSCDLPSCAFWLEEYTASLSSCNFCWNKVFWGGFSKLLPCSNHTKMRKIYLYVWHQSFVCLKLPENAKSACVVVFRFGTHIQRWFGADAMNKSTDNIWIICLSVMHSDCSWFWLVAVAEFSYRWWAGELKSDNIRGIKIWRLAKHICSSTLLNFQGTCNLEYFPYMLLYTSATLHLLNHYISQL